jgi:hypothetical protein
MINGSFVSWVVASQTAYQSNFSQILPTMVVNTYLKGIIFRLQKQKLIREMLCN